MKKLFLTLALLPLMAIAGNVKSPNGNIELKFSSRGGKTIIPGS